MDINYINRRPPHRRSEAAPSSISDSELARQDGVAAATIWRCLMMSMTDRTRVTTYWPCSLPNRKKC